MAYGDQAKRNLEVSIQQEVDRIRELRRYERGLRDREKSLSTMPQFDSRDKRLGETLKKFLPTYLIPGNVGHLNQVTWNFWFNVTVDFGDNPTLTPNSRQDAFFRVSEESGLLLNAVSHHAESYTTSGRLGPYNVTFRDLQSSRQFNDNPIPIQMIGRRGRPTVLPTPMLLMPNALLRAEMSTVLTGAESQVTVGKGTHIFTFFGYRIRVEDYQNVSSTVYGR